MYIFIRKLTARSSLSSGNLDGHIFEAPEELLISRLAMTVLLMSLTCCCYRCLETFSMRWSFPLWLNLMLKSLEESGSSVLSDYRHVTVPCKRWHTDPLSKQDLPCTCNITTLSHAMSQCKRASNIEQKIPLLHYSGKLAEDPSLSDKV